MLLGLDKAKVDCTLCETREQMPSLHVIQLDERFWVPETSSERSELSDREAPIKYALSMTKKSIAPCRAVPMSHSPHGQGDRFWVPEASAEQSNVAAREIPIKYTPAFTSKPTVPMPRSPRSQETLDELNKIKAELQEALEKFESAEKKRKQVSVSFKSAFFIFFVKCIEDSELCCGF